jgi:hypothetical protein
MKGIVDETPAKKGADGKRCWKGKRYAGTENGKDKCIPVKEGDVVPFKKKTDKDKYNTAIAKQRGPLPISYIDPDSAITVKSRKPGDQIEIPDEYQDINLKSKVRGVPKQNQTNFEVWGNDHGYYVFGNNTNAVLSAWPNGEMMVLSDPSDSKGRENCQRFAKQVMKPIELDSLRPKLKNKILQKMSMIDQPMNEAANPAQQAAIAVNMKKKGQKPKHVDEAKAKQYVKPFMRDGEQVGWMSSDGYHKKYWQMFAKASAIKHAKLNPDEVQEDYASQYSAEKTATVNPHAGVKDRQFRGAIGEGIAEATAGHRFALPNEIATKYGIDGDTYNKLASMAMAVKQQLLKGSHFDQAISKLNIPAELRDTMREGAMNSIRSMFFVQDVKAYQDEHGGIAEAREMSPELRAAQKNLVDLASGEVRRREEARKAAEKRQREYDREFNQKPKKPSLDQIWQKVEHAISNYYPDGDPTDYLNPYMQKTGITWDDITRAAKRNGYKDLWDYWNSLTQDIENDAYYDWMAAKRPETPSNPLSRDAADIQHRDWVAKKNPQIRTRAPFMEQPETSGPVGTQPGGWRKYKAKPAGEIEEDTSYAGGMGQGGNAGQSYRKFKPKSAGTFKEEQLDEYREMSPELRAAQQNMIALSNKTKAAKVPDKKERVARVPNTPDKPKAPEILAKGGQAPNPEMDKMMADFLAKGGEIKKGRPGKAPPIGRNQASLHIGGAGTFKRRGDRPGQGAKYRGDKDVQVEEEQLDEKCWDGYKQVGMKKKGDKMVPNCVQKESAIMKGILGKK